MTLTSLLASFAAAFTQNQRLLTLQLGDGSRWNEMLLPLAVHGDEAVSDGYRYRVECLSPDAGIEFKALLGVPVRLGIAGQDGSEVVRCGVVSAAETLGSDGGFARYALTVEPPFALLRLRQTSRVFQDLSVDAIVRQIFAEHAAANPVFAAGQALDFVLASSLPSRSYCLQYRESDYNFIVRLLHEEGLAWRFEHIDGNTPQVKLVAFDDPYAPPPAPLERVRFHRSDATEDEDGLTGWDGARRIVSGSVALASFDYQPVATGHSGDSSAVDQGTDGARLQASLQDYDGAGSVRGLAAGQWFRLDDHPAHEGDSAEQREFVVTRQRFTVRNNLPAELARSLPASPQPSLTAAGDAPTKTRRTTPPSAPSAAACRSPRPTPARRWPSPPRVAPRPPPWSGRKVKISTPTATARSAPAMACC